MSVDALKILEPGLFTTVQDKGRYGYQRFGVPVSGAMDVFALRVANILVGNDDGAAGLEMTVVGPKITFLADTWIAVTGADLSPMLDDTPLPQWESVMVPKDSVLGFQGARDGMRSYLAVGGGIDVPVVMGSRSTYTKSGFGGLEGRALKAGDVLRTRATETGTPVVKRRLPHHLEPPLYGQEHEIRVVLGPQDKAFTQAGIATFLGSKYSVSMDSDRMGSRVDGPPIEHISGPDIVSDGTALGAVQIPGDGCPIILLADRGTTGGYTKIATAIGPDVDELAQAMPGDTVKFKSVTVEEAHAILEGQETLLRAIRTGSAAAASSAKVSVLVEGEAFEVVSESGEAMALPDVGNSPGGESHHVRATADGQTFEFDVEIRHGQR